MSGIEIRPATLEDVEILVTLRLEMRRERETVKLALPENEFAGLLRDFFTRTLENGSFVSFIAWDGETAAACSGLSLIELPPSYGDLPGKKGYITNMYTRVAYRKRGIAGKLLDALREYAVNAGCSKLELNASSAGYGVYKKYGFYDVTNEMEMKI